MTFDNEIWDLNSFSLRKPIIESGATLFDNPQPKVTKKRKKIHIHGLEVTSVDFLDIISRSSNRSPLRQIDQNRKVPEAVKRVDLMSMNSILSLDSQGSQSQNQVVEADRVEVKDVTQRREIEGDVENDLKQTQDKVTVIERDIDEDLRQSRNTVIERDIEEYLRQSQKNAAIERERAVKANLEWLNDVDMIEDSEDEPDILDTSALKERVRECEYQLLINRSVPYSLDPSIRQEEESIEEVEQIKSKQEEEETIMEVNNTVEAAQTVIDAEESLVTGVMEEPSVKQVRNGDKEQMHEDPGKAEVEEISPDVHKNKTQEFGSTPPSGPLVKTAPPETTKTKPLKRRPLQGSLASLCSRTNSSTTTFRVGLSKRTRIDHLHKNLSKK